MDRSEVTPDETSRNKEEKRKADQHRAAVPYIIRLSGQDVEVAVSRSRKEHGEMSVTLR